MRCLLVTPISDHEQAPGLGHTKLDDGDIAIVGARGTPACVQAGRRHGMKAAAAAGERL
jgi:hypothetical protein